MQIEFHALADVVFLSVTPQTNQTQEKAKKKITPQHQETFVKTGPCASTKPRRKWILRR